MTSVIIEGTFDLTIGGSDSDIEGLLDETAVFDYALSAEQIDDLINGRYNPNDLIVTPNVQLPYQAPVTNTHTIRRGHANGTPLSTGFSARFSRIGQASLYTLFKPSATTRLFWMIFDC